MGPDLFSACVFCAGLLLGMELPPFEATSAEMGAAYATFARHGNVPGARLHDISDVTPKFVGIGLRGSWPARGGLGAGTPEREWRARLAVAPSHDEQTQRPIIAPGRTRATGSGRFENFAVLYRQPLSPANSVEVAWNRRFHKSTDLVNAAGENFELSEQRVLTSERVDMALGWRHRRPRLELAAGLRYTRPNGAHNTARSFHFSRGDLFGAQAEARWQIGPWTLRLAGESAGGDIDVHEESSPDFANRDFAADATVRAVTFAAGWARGRTDAWFTVTYDEARLPFVSHAVLGHETILFDDGFHPESESWDTIWDVTVRREVSSTVRARLFLRAVWGKERVTLTDSRGQRLPEQLELERGGDTGKGISSLKELGSPQIVLGLGAEFSLRGRR